MYKILKNNKIILSETPGTLAGYKPDKIFGTLNCKSGMRMKRDNRVFFHSLEDAVKQGYRPCKNCKPINQSDFDKIKHLVPEKTLEEFYNRKKYIKYFNSFNNESYNIKSEPEVGDYVILHDHAYYLELIEFFKHNIGRIIYKTTKNEIIGYPDGHFLVKFDKYMPNVENLLREIPVDRNDILYHAKNKEDLEIFVSANKFNV